MPETTQQCSQEGGWLRDLYEKYSLEHFLDGSWAEARNPPSETLDELEEVTFTPVSCCQLQQSSAYALVCDLTTICQRRPLDWTLFCLQAVNTFLHSNGRGFQQSDSISPAAWLACLETPSTDPKFLAWQVAELLRKQTELAEAEGCDGLMPSEHAAWLRESTAAVAASTGTDQGQQDNLCFIAETCNE